MEVIIRVANRRSAGLMPTFPRLKIGPSHPKRKNRSSLWFILSFRSPVFKWYPLNKLKGSKRKKPATTQKSFSISSIWLDLDLFDARDNCDLCTVFPSFPLARWWRMNENCWARPIIDLHSILPQRLLVDVCWNRMNALEGIGQLYFQTITTWRRLATPGDRWHRLCTLSPTNASTSVNKETSHSYVSAFYLFHTCLSCLVFDLIKGATNYVSARQ